MESYIINGCEITDATTTREGNALILRKGRTTLLSSKIMLIALLNVENRINYQPDTRKAHYYNKLQNDTGVDYCNGLVSEINVSDLRHLLNRANSGSFYNALKELFSTDPRDEKSLRNSWAVMMPNNESGILGYAEVITACHYDTINGRLFLKFSGEPQVFKQLWKIQEDYTDLPFKYMLELKSVHSYRLVEILLQRISAVEHAVVANGDVKPHEYSFRFSVGELQLMLGVVDVSKDKDLRQIISGIGPDYNAIVEETMSRKYENMGTFANFRRYALDVAIDEINNNNTSPFNIAYDVERGSNRKISFIIFNIKMKGQYVEESDIQVKTIDELEFIVDLTRMLNVLELTYAELKQIAEVSEYDKDLVQAAYMMYNKLNVNDNFAEWFLALRT